MSPMATTAWVGLAGTVFMGVVTLFEGQFSVHNLSYFGWRECVGGVCILLGVYLTARKINDSAVQAA